MHVRNEDMRKSLWHDIFDFNACKDPCRYMLLSKSGCWIECYISYVLCLKRYYCPAHTHTHITNACNTKISFVSQNILYERVFNTLFYIHLLYDYYPRRVCWTMIRSFWRVEIKDFHIQKRLVLKMKGMKTILL